MSRALELLLPCALLGGIFLATKYTPSKNTIESNARMTVAIDAQRSPFHGYGNCDKDTGMCVYTIIDREHTKDWYEGSWRIGTMTQNPSTKEWTVIAAFGPQYQASLDEQHQVVWREAPCFILCTDGRDATRYYAQGAQPLFKLEKSGPVRTQTDETPGSYLRLMFETIKGKDTKTIFELHGEAYRVDTQRRKSDITNYVYNPKTKASYSVLNVFGF